MGYCKLEATYPPAKAGYKRIMFVLDPNDDGPEKKEYQLELIPGRMLALPPDEGDQKAMLTGKINECEVGGLGYPYYEVELEENPEDQPPLSEDGEEYPKRFVPMGNRPVLPYNSKVPMVVYLPMDADLRYSTWMSGEVFNVCPEE